MRAAISEAYTKVHTHTQTHLIPWQIHSLVGRCERITDERNELKDLCATISHDLVSSRAAERQAVTDAEKAQAAAEVERKRGDMLAMTVANQEDDLRRLEEESARMRMQVGPSSSSLLSFQEGKVEGDIEVLELRAQNVPLPATSETDAALHAALSARRMSGKQKEIAVEGEGASGEVPLDVVHLHAALAASERRGKERDVRATRVSWHVVRSRASEGTLTSDSLLH